MDDMEHRLHFNGLCSPMLTEPPIYQLDDIEETLVWLRLDVWREITKHHSLPFTE